MVDVFIEGCATRDPGTMARAGYAFGHLHKLLGGDPEIRPRLVKLMRDAAAARVLGEAKLDDAA